MSDAESLPESERFWFTTWREKVTFHSTPDCRQITNNGLSKDVLGEARIPKKANRSIYFCPVCAEEYADG
jgi:hypothetical protein